MGLDTSVPTSGTGRVSSPPSETMTIYAAKHEVRSVTGGHEPRARRWQQGWPRSEGAPRDQSRGAALGRPLSSCLSARAPQGGGPVMAHLPLAFLQDAGSEETAGRTGPLSGRPALMSTCRGIHRAQRRHDRTSPPPPAPADSSGQQAVGDPESSRRPLTPQPL